MGGRAVIMVVALGSALACSRFDSSSANETDGGSSSSGSSTSSSSSSSSGAAIDGGPCPACPLGAFCDPFERDDPAGSGWVGLGDDDRARFAIRTETPAKVGCGSLLFVDVGEPKTHDYLRMLSRLVMLPVDAKELSISFDVAVETRGTYAPDVDFSAFAALSHNELDFSKPFVALTFDRDGAAIRAHDVAGPDLKTALALDSVAHHVEWRVARTGTISVDVDGNPAHDTVAASFPLTTPLYLAVGLGSPKGNGGSMAWIDNVVIEMK